MKEETEQIITNKRNKRKFIVPVIFCICFVVMVSMVIPMALAYFTATSNQTGELSFAALTTSIIDNSGNTMTNGTFSSTFLSEKLLPGKEINFTNIKVKNTSNTNIYTLLKLTVTITKTGVATLTYTNWYTLNGEIVSTSNFSTNNHYATYLSSNSTANVNLTYTIPTEINNDYKSATAEFTLSAHSIQDYIPAVEEYLEKINYATYLIVKKTDNLETDYTFNNNMFGYVRVEYLESTGTQYIDTGFTPNSDTKINMVISLNALRAYQALFCARGDSYNINTITLFNADNQGNWRFDYNNQVGIVTSGYAISIGTIHDIEINKNIFMLDGITVVTYAQSSFTAGSNLLLLTSALYQGGEFVGFDWFTSANLYEVKIYDNNTLTRDFVPCVRVSDTKPGLYDRVNDVFYTNAGTGEFLYG